MILKTAKSEYVPYNVVSRAYLLSEPWHYVLFLSGPEIGTCYCSTEYCERCERLLMRLQFSINQFQKGSIFLGPKQSYTTSKS